MNRRKNYFIDKKFQTNFILKFCLLVAATGGLIMATLYLLTKKATTVSIMSSRVVVQSTADFIFPVLIQTFIVATIIVSIATIFFTLFVSHRIAGPAHRFKKILSALRDGDFSGECRIRRTDSFQNVAASLNEMMTGVKARLVLIGEAIAMLKDKVEDMSKHGPSDGADIKELKKEVSELEKALHHFKF